MRMSLHSWLGDGDPLVEIALYIALGLGVGITNAQFISCSVKVIFDPAKLIVKFLKSHLYLTVVATTKLQWHLSNMMVIFNNQCFDYFEKLRK